MTSNCSNSTILEFHKKRTSNGINFSFHSMLAGQASVITVILKVWGPWKCSTCSCKEGSKNSEVPEALEDLDLLLKAPKPDKVWI